MIFQQELEGLRHQKWHIHPAAKERPLRTLDDAREFLNSIGFCLMYPVKPPLVAATFIGAYLNSKDNLPSPAQALLDARAKEAESLSSRLLNEKAAFQVGFANDGVLLVSSVEFPYFYALIGERNPKQPPNAGVRGERALLTHTFETIQQHGPLNELEIRERLGRSISDTAVVRAVHDLWAQLRVVRVSDQRWDVLYRWAPEQVNAGKQMSAREALSALISKYLETVIAAEQKDVEDFFSPMVARSRVAEVIRAMQGAREFSHVQVAGKMLLCLAARGEEVSDLTSIGSAREKETAALEKIQAADLKFQLKRNAAKKFDRRPGERKFAPKQISSGKPFERKANRPDKKFDKKRSVPAKSFDPKGKRGPRKTFANPRRSQ